MNKKVTQRVIAMVLIIALIASIAITINLFSLRKAASAAENVGFVDIPQITVLTHGLSSSASHWSNYNGSGSGGFVEDPDSLVYKLSQKAGGATIYRAVTNSNNGENPNYHLYLNYSNTQTDINSISKHIIIVFDSANSEMSNDIVYSEFEHMLDDVVDRVTKLNPGNKKPKVNLIGHSRGGLTNLEYAINNPESIDSLISIGTPYFGSKVAEIAGPILYPPPPGVSEDDEEYGLSDINNEIIYNKYYNDWTAGYETKYKDINSIAIGGAQGKV